MFEKITYEVRTRMRKSNEKTEKMRKQRNDKRKRKGRQGKGRKKTICHGLVNL